ncbi:TonB-dependent receptor family protein [Ottowia sp.]|uniref:TonB-dependent receptor family protein n=1 Tax=Ottowia sp. TaxID=1898956 RepID=UPI003C731C73
MPRAWCWGPAVCGLLWSTAAVAQEDSERAASPDSLNAVVVTATRIDAPGFDVPASIDRLEGDEIRANRAQVNISESLAGVPGLQARDRQNYAQDVQLSLRGFGARSTFGIRGVRVYVDGIPATLPDGQGQISHVSLGSVGHMEVLRGPFSALYGNSSGGVIQVFTEEGSGPPRLRFDAAAGSDGMSRIGAVASGERNGIGYVVEASRFRTDGYREHSATERGLANAKLTVRPDDDSKLTLVASHMSLPRAQDPLGLSRAQFEANPRGVDPAAINFDTRKTVEQTQAGVTYERRIDSANAFALTTYAGTRSTTQFQSIPVATQGSPLHPGGVIALDRDYLGADFRWTHQTQLLDAPLTIVAGLAYDGLKEHRQGFLNYTGSAAAPVLGEQGAQRRNERNDVSNADQYLQGTWQLTPKLSLNAGLRHSKVRFDSRDNYIVGTNPDDSGKVDYGAYLPVFGALYALTPDLHVYASAGRGFETPTLNELAYRPAGGTGLNFALGASSSTSVEVGLKSRSPIWGEATIAVFQTNTQNEIVTQTNSGGRTTYQNAGATRRTGFELGWNKRFPHDWQVQLAYTMLNARYRDAFATCAATPCTVPTAVIPAGNHIPGLARNTLVAAVNWAPAKGWRAGAEMRYIGRVFVNDANTDAASGYTVMAATVGYFTRLGPWTLNGFVRVDNLFARKYAGSVIVNEGNGRYFEPAPGRTWLAGLSATLEF